MKCLFAALASLVISTLAVAAPLELKAGDHICIIGNTLADRMQHDGWLETLLQARFPDHKFVFRNLGFSGDELSLRLRSKSFGTPDQWLAGSAPVPEPSRLTTRKGVRENRFETTNTKADVVFAFFGYNESYAGAAGLDKFKSDLKTFITHTLSQKYNGKTAPRFVLFSPIAHEDLKDRNLPDGKENNRRLELYTKAMAEVAAAENVAFVDLFGPTHKLYDKAEKPLTINGVHLNEKGNELVARAIDRALFGAEPEKMLAGKELEKLRQAVVDKNFYWVNRYRVMDGYNVYGGRAFERYADMQSNYEDQQRELEILDVMTSNRDKLVWARARGGDLKVDDSNVPPYIAVKTNKPGKGPDGAHIFLSGEEEIKQMKVAKGMKVTLFASEKEFPELAKPVQMAFDAKGRLWVAVWPSYPHWKPGEPRNDKLLILEDTKGTGRADKCTVFADGLNCPTGFEFYNGGVLVAQAPDLVFLKDTKGTGKADLHVRVLHGLDSADSHHTSNSFTLDPGGALYFQEGTFHHTQVESPYGPTVRCVNAGVFRYEPRTQKFDVYVTYGFANPHGHVFDRWGQDIVIDGTGANAYHAALFSGYLPFPEKHRTPPQVYGKHPRPCPGMEYLSSRHFPAEFQGNLLVANVIGFQGILRYKISDKGGSQVGEELEPIVSSTDPNFRPSDLKIGPDGAIWFIDWHNPIIGHLQHAIRDPNRDRTHGRIYRVTYEDRKLLAPVSIAGEPIDKLLTLLEEPEDRVRYRAKIELGARKTDDVIAAVKKWTDLNLLKKDPEAEHNLLEALWVHQYHNVVNVDLLKRVLGSKDFRARAAATRVLCYWRDRVPNALDLLKKLADDENPRVRLEAVRAASFFKEPEAIEVVLVAQDRPSDPFVDFVAVETRRALDPIWKAALASGKTVPVTTDAGARFFLRNMTLEQLLKLTRTRSVNRELLYRPGVRDELRREALRALAREEKKPELRVLLDAVARIDDKTENREEQTLFDLIRMLNGRTPAELADVRADLEKLALASRQPVIRQIGYVALVNVDGSTDKAWALALKSVGNLRDLVNAVPMIADPALRASLYPKLEALLSGLPKELKGAGETKAVKGRYVRIELPGRGRTLTLAEVEVYRDGVNIARKGKASQKNTAHGGSADKAIDGNKAGTYSEGGQTHTLENTSNPWWEVDLGSEQPIDSIVIYNRTDGGLGKRLDGFTLQVLDKTHKEVLFERKGQPAPTVSARFEVGGEAPAQLVKRAAMNALTTVRGQEAKSFQTLAQMVRHEEDRSDAIHALQRIPRSFWDKEQAKPLLDVLLTAIRKIPAKERTSPAALDALEMADALTTLLPADDAKKVRAELGELGVRVIRIGTVVEKMSYDKDVVVVRAGKPVEFLFENVDLMPHNLVITKPGALQEIGELAEASAQQADAQARHFVPKSDKILLASTLLQPREVQKLSFVAPKHPGVYPIVCTYPGHWRRMYLSLYVVDDLDGYLANPEAYLTKNPVPIKDNLLKDRRPRTEWKFDELSTAARELKARSYANGKSMFQVAVCISCHKMEGAGKEFGPDLTKLDAKIQAPEEILRHILEPSLKIDDKYVTWIFETKKGKTITGMILEETKDEVKIIENPLARAEATVLKKADLDSRMKSPISLMPKGLLDKLSRDEILDLIAYIVAKGEKTHKLFQAEGHEHRGH